MTSENCNKLVNIYPDFFKFRLLHVKSNMYMRIYDYILGILHKYFIWVRKYNYYLYKNPYKTKIGVGNGWYGIIESGIYDILSIDKKYKSKTRLVDIKEKFGGLRIYVHGSNLEHIIHIVDRMEKESYGVCEITGSTEDVGTWTRGWIRTISRGYAELKYKSDIVIGDIPMDVPFSKCWIPQRQK